MKRADELVVLSREHHQSLRLAKKCLDSAGLKDESVCIALCEHIVAIFDEEWERHFQVEECSIFSPGREKGSELSRLCLELAEQHQQMREMVGLMKPGNCQLLEEFGSLLKSHTRIEERELFPLVEELFTKDQLQLIDETSKG